MSLSCILRQSFLSSTRSLWWREPAANVLSKALSTSEVSLKTFKNPFLYSHFLKFKTLTLIEGDGIGPEISNSVKEIFKAAQVEMSHTPTHYLHLLIVLIFSHAY